jgi:hypothetical protein
MAVAIAPIGLGLMVGSVLIAIAGLLYFSSKLPLLVLLFLPLFALVGVQIGRTSLGQLRYTYQDEPLRFNRENGKVYRFRIARKRILGIDVPAKKQAAIEVYDWSNIRAEITRHFLLFGPTGRRDSFLQLAVIDPATGKVTDRFRIGDRDTHGGFIDRLFLWESIRRFMEEGPQRVPPTSLKLHRNNLTDCFEEFNPFSLPGKFAPGGQRVFGYLIAIAVWVTSPLLMYAALCRWIAGRTGRKVDWGELDQTVFKMAKDDPAAKNTRDPSIEAPKMWSKETRRRQRAQGAWLVSMGLYWLFPAYFLQVWPYCSCAPEAGFCIELESLCPHWRYGDPMPTQPAAKPMPGDRPGL